MVKVHELSILLPKLSSTNKTSEELQKRIQNKNKIIVVSPHLDDAVLSMGSLISNLASEGKDLEVISVFTDSSSITSPSIQIILMRAGFKDASDYFKARHREDKNALGFLGVKKINNLGFIDAAWRKTKTDKPVYPNNQLADISPLDEEIIQKLDSFFLDYAKKYPDAIFFAPLALGNHADHQIARNSLHKNAPNVIFYADFPYSATHGITHPFIDSNNLSQVEWDGDYKKKKEAILLYKTQLPSFIPFSNNGVLQLSLEKFYISILTDH